MKKQPEVTAATRRRLIDAFWTVYEKKRIEQIHIKEIASLAYVHRGTFYEYFNDIFDLLQKEEEALINEIIVNAKKIQSADIDGMLKQLADVYTRNGKHLCMLIGKDGDPDFIHKFKNALYPSFLKMRALPNSGMICAVYEFGINGLIMAFHSWYNNPERIPVAEFLRVMRSVIDNGIPKTLASMTN